MKTNIFNNLKSSNNSMVNVRATQSGKGTPIRKNFVPHSCENNLYNSKKSADVNFQGGFFATNKLTHSIAEFAADNAGIFESGFAVLLTCFARPITVMATPGVKKQDKQYAAAQSIASGTVGLAVTTPIMKYLGNEGAKVHDRVVISKLEHLKDNSELFKKLEDKTFEEAITSLNETVKKVTDPYKKQLDDLKEQKVHAINAKDKVTKKSLAKQIEKVSKELDEAMNKALNIPKELKEYNIPTAIQDLYKQIEKLNGSDKTMTEKEIKHAAKKFKHINKLRGEKLVKVLADSKLPKEMEYLKNAKSYSVFKYITTSYGAKFILAPILAFTMIKLIKPVVKIVFPKSKKDVDQNQKQNSNINFTQLSSMSTIDKSIYKDFIKRGV